MEDYNQLKDKCIKLENELYIAKEALWGLNKVQCEFWEQNECHWINEDEWCNQCSSFCCYENCYYKGCINVNDDDINEGKCSAECKSCKNMFCITCVNSSTNFECYKCINKSEKKNSPRCKYQYIHGQNKGAVCGNYVDIEQNDNYCVKCLQRPEVKYWLNK